MQELPIEAPCPIEYFACFYESMEHLTEEPTVVETDRIPVQR